MIVFLWKVNQCLNEPVTDHHRSAVKLDSEHLFPKAMSLGSEQQESCSEQYTWPGEPGLCCWWGVVHLTQSSRVQTKARDTSLEYNVTSLASIPGHSPAFFSPSIIFTRALLCSLRQAVHPGVVSQKGTLIPAKIYWADIMCYISGIPRGRR